MSATTISNNLKIQANVKYSGLSQLSSDNEHFLTTRMLEGWVVVVWIPKAPPGSDAPSDFTIFVLHKLMQMPRHVIKVTMTVKKLNGEAEFSKSWDEEAPKTYALKALMTDIGDGFDLIIRITTEPSTSVRPLIYNIPILRTISTLILRPDAAADTKFLLFSRRRRREHPHGAHDPLPVYANSAFLKSQCEYFKDSKSNLWAKCDLVRTVVYVTSVLRFVVFGIATIAIRHTT
jgi:hypothetical protein